MSTRKAFDSKSKNKSSNQTKSGDTESSAPVLEVTSSDSDNSPKDSAPIIGVNAVIKRLCDLIIGGAALVILSPLLIVLAILIKLDSSGPALFCQQRRGRNLEVINVYKFRTMYQDYSIPEPTAHSFVQTSKNDVRVTSIGATLRKTSLDELPQLINVLKGSMSLVGPRPHPLPLDEQYSLIIPSLNSRYVIKPGITGWAQINGYRGETTRLQDMMARIEHDCHYIDNWSLWLDIKIIAITAFKGWTHNNAY